MSLRALRQLLYVCDVITTTRLGPCYLGPCVTEVYGHRFSRLVTCSDPLNGIAILQEIAKRAMTFINAPQHDIMDYIIKHFLLPCMYYVLCNYIVERYHGIKHKQVDKYYLNK